MSVSYRLVQWNKHKKVYDLVLWAGIVLYIAAFVGISQLIASEGDPLSMMTALLRATGTASLILLHLILMIGPLARLSAKFNILLYNRRHAGVSMFILGLVHAGLVLLWYGGFGNTNPFSAVLGGDWADGPPFEVYGFFALIILFVMAATSHDFWLKNLSPKVWKVLHMGVYVAWFFLIAHVGWGALQDETSPVIAAIFALGVVLVVTLHVFAGLKQRNCDKAMHAEVLAEDGWVPIDAPLNIEPGRAKAVAVTTPCGKTKEVAVFRHGQNGEKFSAMVNVCAHQGGPLAEGKLVTLGDTSCVTCPWHGYQYLPENGQSPPPFTEKITTFELRVRGNQLELNPKPLAPGTEVAPAILEAGGAS